MEESGTERKEKEVERKAKRRSTKEFKEHEKGRTRRIEEYFVSRSGARKNGGSRLRRAELRGGGKSPRVFGPCLSSSFVPKLRLFSWPSFSRFVHPWAQSSARVRKREKESVIPRKGGRRMKHAVEEEEC